MCRLMFASVVAALALFHWVVEPLPAAEVVRLYTFDDPGAVKGEVTEETFDSNEFQETADIGPTVTLEGFGTYVEGREDPSTFAMHFDGDTDYFESIRFDPRDFGGGFTALSQAWVQPSSDGNGLRQHVWALGTDNGGVAITEGGFWELISGGPAGSVVSPRVVDFDKWSHVTVRRTGNNGFLYINGSLVTTNGGFWNVPGDVVLGAGPDRENLFNGVVDDFMLSGFFQFDLIRDIKFFDPNALSGVPGDVNQDSLINIDDYTIWSTNVGFDNGLGLGDVNTLFRGDVDQNGRVNYFDFDIIRTEAAAAGTPITIPEPTTGLLLILGLSTLLFFRNAGRRVV